MPVFPKGHFLHDAEWSNLTPGQYPRSLWKYTSYWRVWSRVIQFRNVGSNWSTPCVEIDLTPTDFWSPRPWTPDQVEYISSIGVRRHVTPTDSSDVLVSVLPQSVLDAMKANLDPMTVMFLTQAPVLSYIRPMYLRGYLNVAGSHGGGSPLAAIAATEELPRIPPEVLAASQRAVDRIAKSISTTPQGASHA